MKKNTSLNCKQIFIIIFVIGIFFVNSKVFAYGTSDSKVSLQQIGGRDKIETAVLTSKYQWKSTSEYAIVASQEDFFGSTCAVPLASKFNCPILLTEKNTLSKNTKDEISRLGAKNVYVIGSKDIISESVENELKRNVKTVNRVSGKDQADISVKIALIIGSCEEIFLVNEKDFPDALSIASIAAKKKAPIIITDGKELSTGAIDYINNNSIKQSYIIGGQALVSDNILNRLPNSYRIFGENRYETNIQIIKHFGDELKLDNIFVVPGENINSAIEGIPASVVAESTSSPVLLTGNIVNPYTNSFIKSNNFNINNAVIIGGDSTLASKDLKIFNEVSNMNAKEYIETVTYDGSNQSCHPKVLYFPKKWAGWKYWMVFTPYPNGNDQYENPSILVSQTDCKWSIPKGLKNPVVSGLNQKGCHLSDPHLVFNEGLSQMELWYRATYFDKEDRIIRLTSKDGVNWSAPQNMVSFYGEKECLSPAIIFENNIYKMWYVNEKLKCMYIESSDGTNWSAPKEVSLNLTDSYVPWHLDVIKTDLGYEILFSVFKAKEAIANNRVLMWGTSQDGLSFNNSVEVLTPSKDADAWDNKQIYRSSFIKNNGMYKVFYSAMNRRNQWHIGLTKGKSMKDLHGHTYRSGK
jgi:putative cell wall-binding protein